MIAELRDSLENLYPDSRVGTPICTQMRTDVARGGVAAIHVLICGGEKGGVLSLRLLENGRRERKCKWYMLRPVPVEENTGLIGFTESSMKGSEPPNAPNPHAVRRAPFRTYDAMEPIEDEVRMDGDTAAVRCHVPMPADAMPGEVTYELRVKLGNSESALLWHVRVFAAVIPESGCKTFPVTNWFSYENVASRHGLKMWSEEYWEMLKKYAALMAWGRQNAFWVPLSVIFEMSDGKPILLRERLRRVVDVFTGAGLHYVEGGHVAHRTGGRWEAATFDVVLSNVVATSPAGHRILLEICRQLMDEIERNRWGGRWIQHATDEPTATNASEYRILVGMIRKYMPGIPVLDATMDPSLVGSVDIWCPQVQEYQKHRANFEEQRALAGDRVWFYTCCFPGGPWLNRLLDEELVRPALFGWAAGLFNLDGFLHWGLNQYRDDQNPFEKSVIPNWGGGASSLPAGDTHVVYPGLDGPWSSLRFESQREGWEDYELLKEVACRDRTLMERIVKRAIRGFDDYAKTAAELRAARLALLEAC